MNQEDSNQGVADKAGPIILEALKKYLVEIVDNGHNEIHVPPELSINANGDNVSELEAFDRWVGVINRMIYAFEDHISLEEFDGIWENGESGEVIISDKHKFSKFEKAQKEHVAKVKAGMKLFAKHYEYL